MKPFAYEITRLKTLRSTWILSGLALLFSIATAFLVIPITKSEPSAQGWSAIFTISVSTVVAFCCAFFGVFAFGHEYRYGTIRPTLTALPRRTPVAIAKVVVAAGFSFVLALACLLVTFLIAAPLRNDEISDGLFSAPLPRVLLGVSLYATGFCLLGAGLTAIFRNQVVGIVVVLIMPLIVENAIIILLELVDFFEPIRELSNYLPFGSGRAMYQVNIGTQNADVVEALSPLRGGLIYFAWGLAICALGIWRFKRSDA
jgi:ABC-2 type transport system permease protein